MRTAAATNTATASSFPSRTPISPVRPRYRRADGHTLRPEPQRRRLAARQRIRRRLLRSRSQGPVPRSGCSKKYGTIENLNQHWATAYWSQTYDNFDQIPVRARDENPALLLDWKRFVSDTWKSYSLNQIDAIRPHADPRQFITTNTMGWFDGFDEYTVHSVLDIAAWDDYIGAGNYDTAANGAAPRPHPRLQAQEFLGHGNRARLRQLASDEYAAREGPGARHGMAGHRPRSRTPSNIGNGAPHLNGQEEYHGVLVGIDGNPCPSMTK